MIRCFRDEARIPESISDDKVYEVVNRESLHYSDSNEDEKQETLAYLRQELGLEDVR